MNAPADNTPEFLLLFRGHDWDKGLSVEETEQVMDRVMAWFEGLEKRGIVRGTRALGRSGGSTVSGADRRIVADGPFVESKEGIGGYLVVAVDTMEEALAIARACPTLDYNVQIDVRAVLDECPVMKRLRERRSEALVLA